MRLTNYSFRQLTKLPVNPKRFGGVCIDPASDADTYETKLRDGDIVILYVSPSARTHKSTVLNPERILQTDGLSDNVFASELVSICSLVSRQYAHSPPPPPISSSGDQAQKVAYTEEDAQVQTIAERIVNYAQLCMKNKKRVSPFERAAAREGMYFRGGVSLLTLADLKCVALNQLSCFLFAHFRNWTSESLKLASMMTNSSSTFISVTVLVAMVRETL